MSKAMELKVESGTLLFRTRGRKRWKAVDTPENIVEVITHLVKEHGKDLTRLVLDFNVYAGKLRLTSIAPEYEYFESPYAGA